jgi:hypothetical protein
MPNNATEQDKKRAEGAVQSLRATNQTGLVFPGQKKD